MNTFPHLNDTYISEKLKKQLFAVGRYPVTTVTAPTGYGKTTAMKWWNEYRKRYIPGSKAYGITVVDSSPDHIWNELCRAFADQDEELADQMRELGYPDTKMSMMLLDELWKRGNPEKEGDVFFILDDVQLLPRDDFVPLIMFIAERMAPNMHIVLLSRDRIFTASQTMKMGRSLLSVRAEDLQLGAKEVADYGRGCGIKMSDEEARELAGYSGGWISLIYLIFCVYTETGRWQPDAVDIDSLIKEVMIDPLSEDERRFITVLSVVPEFTEETASYLWNGEGASEMLRRLTGENAFITRNRGGVYRFHNLLRVNTEKMFRKLPEEEQESIWTRLGDWNISSGEILGAMRAYRKGCCWDRLLETVTEDRGSSFGGVHIELIYEWTDSCPPEILRKHPYAILIFALQFFTGDDIPRMMELRDILMETVKDDPGLSERERNSFEGEVELLMSFLGFNDIEAMSRHHRKACTLLDRESLLIKHRNPWTFGSPSVLMLYHRSAGGCDAENGEMMRCMPYYYKLTGRHGNGAEYSMQAETYLLQGNIRDAEISYYQACHAALSTEQYSILITAEFTAMRLNLICGEYEAARSHYDLLMKRIADSRQYILLPSADLCGAWISSVLGHSEIVAEWILEEGAEDTLMSVAKPVFMVMRGQVLMAMEKWAVIISRGEDIKEMCSGSSMLLCGIYARIQMAGAYHALDKDIRAEAELKEAVALAEPDGLILPFAENGPYIMDMLRKMASRGYFTEFIEKVAEMEKKVDDARTRIGIEHFGEMPDYGLTASERDIAVLAAGRRTTKEIAESLHLSENTVKTHLRHIFAKLNISGSSRNKRDMLEKLFDKDHQG